MRKVTLGDLQESLADKSGFTQLADMLLFYGNGVCGFEDAAGHRRRR